MNKLSKTHKPKGISVDGFWRQLQDKSAQTDTGQPAINARDLPSAKKEFFELPDPKENWETRFDQWLDRL